MFSIEQVEEQSNDWQVYHMLLIALQLILYHLMHFCCHMHWQKQQHDVTVLTPGQIGQMVPYQIRQSNQLFAFMVSLRFSLFLVFMNHSSSQIPF